MSKISDMRTRLGITESDFNTIIQVYMSSIPDAGIIAADKVPEVLNKYEEEILRQQEVINRLKNKVRNYRSGIKNLQRAHEASLHREAAQRQTIEYLAQGGGVCQIIQVEDGPYSPTRFNNELPAGVAAHAASTAG